MWSKTKVFWRAFFNKHIMRLMSLKLLYCIDKCAPDITVGDTSRFISGRGRKGEAGETADEEGGSGTGWGSAGTPRP